MNYMEYAKYVGRQYYKRGLELGFRGYDIHDFEH